MKNLLGGQALGSGAQSGTLRSSKAVLQLLGQKSRESTEEGEVKAAGAEQGGYTDKVTHELSLEG